MLERTPVGFTALYPQKRSDSRTGQLCSSFTSTASNLSTLTSWRTKRCVKASRSSATGQRSRRLVRCNQIWRCGSWPDRRQHFRFMRTVSCWVVWTCVRNLLRPTRYGHFAVAVRAGGLGLATAAFKNFQRIPSCTCGACKVPSYDCGLTAVSRVRANPAFAHRIHVRGCRTDHGRRAGGSRHSRSVDTGLWQRAGE